MKSTTSFFAVGFCVLLCNSAFADLFHVDYDDADGPSWQGIVDSTTDQLTISLWSENAGGTSYWTPTTLPLVWTARDSSGNVYDIPDSWDGIIDTDFAFISDIINSDNSWNEGSSISATAVGWGGGLTSSGGFAVSGATDRMFFVPSSVGGASSSTADAVTVTAVPEPSAATTLLLGLVLFASKRRRLK